MDASPQVWLVGDLDFQLEHFTPHAVFSDESDAKAYAKLIDGDIHAVPLYPPQSGHPEVLTVWRCAATASVDPARDRAPETSSRTVAALHASVEEREPFRITAHQKLGPFRITIVARGIDRERVEAEVRAKYVEAREVVSARKVEPAGVGE